MGSFKLPVALSLLGLLVAFPETAEARRGRRGGAVTPPVRALPHFAIPVPGHFRNFHQAPTMFETLPRIEQNPTLSLQKLELEPLRQIQGVLKIEENKPISAERLDALFTGNTPFDTPPPLPSGPVPKISDLIETARRDHAGFQFWNGTVGKHMTFIEARRVSIPTGSGAAVLSNWEIDFLVAGNDDKAYKLTVVYTASGERMPIGSQHRWPIAGWEPHLQETDPSEVRVQPDTALAIAFAAYPELRDDAYSIALRPGRNAPDKPFPTYLISGKRGEQPAVWIDARSGEIYDRQKPFRR